MTINYVRLLADAVVKTTDPDVRDVWKQHSIGPSDGMIGVARDPVGIAIGGLSGGEAKDMFIEMVSVSTENLSAHKPRYLMGVGLAVDMLMCVAFGCDLFDCVYPTRTALIGYGKELNLRVRQWHRTSGHWTGSVTAIRA